MNFKEAKQQLIENTVGANDYENISDWDQLREAAEMEQLYARDRVSLLGELIDINE